MKTSHTINTLPKTKLFFLLTFGWSWLFWIFAAVSGFDVGTIPGTLLLGLGGLGPAISAIVLLTFLHRSEERRDFWRRVVDFRRIKLDWYLRLFFLIPVCTLFARTTSFYFQKNLASISEVGKLLDPLLLLPYLLFLLIFGPVPEELGWRGYALDGLQSRWNALSASALLGIVWALWHMPLFFMNGTYQQAEIGLGTLGFWGFMFGMVFSSVLFTWIYNNTSRSILSAILFHFSINLSGEIFSLSEREHCYQTFLITIAALLVLAVWGYKKMTLPTANQQEVLSQVQNNFSNPENQCNKTPVERSTFR